MCSYHNGNRLHLPHDPALQRSSRLRCRDDDEHVKLQNEDLVDGDDYEEPKMYQKDCGESYLGASLGGELKRLRHS